MENTPQYPQTATNLEPSSDQSSVAPAQSQQAYESVPGSQQVQEAYQPVAPAPQDQAPAPQPDYEARIREMEAQSSRLAQQNQQYSQVFQQIKQHTEREQADKEQRERVQAIVARAESMSPGDQSTYIREQMIQLQRQEQVAREQAVQRERDQAQQALKMAAAPQYADHIIQTLGLPKEARDELLALGDPDLMYRQSQAIKTRWDQFSQMQQQIQQYTQQNARTTEVNAMRQNGLTNIGGQAATGFTPENLPSDPNERAMAIYEQIQARKNGYS